MDDIKLNDVVHFVAITSQFTQDCLLAILQVPLNSQSPLRGMTLMDIAKLKKSIAAEEVILQIDKWEASMTKLMKTVRSGRLDSVRDIISRKSKNCLAHISSCKLNCCVLWCIIV